MITFKRDQLITMPSGTVWRVRDVCWRPDTGRLSVGLVDPDNDKRGTAFYADILAKMGVRP